MAARMLIWQGRLSYPGRWLKVGLVLLLLALLPLQYGRDLVSTEATTAVLLAGITLKLLEMQRKRDVLLVLYLCFFTISTEFIHSQSIPVALYMSLATIVVCAALLALHQRSSSQTPQRTLKLAALLLVQSVPLMLVLFVLFPRLSPLWSVALQSNSATTGLSEQMSPGDIGNLARSADLAFRVQFSSPPPPYQELYWRALTLDTFDGREWRRNSNFEAQPLRVGSPQFGWYRALRYAGTALSYNVIMEPTGRNWIYTLMLPQLSDERLVLRRDYQVDSRLRIGQRFTYQAQAYPDALVEAEAEGREQERARLLPEAGNPRALAFARQLRAQYSDDLALVNAVLAHFRREAYFYTLSPALLGADPVDAFLFDSREGFCEHYAGSFTFLMRAAGIPARVVTGYQGGEFNPYDGTLIVRQYDAHAWSEVWLPGQGWLRVDPTAAVSPERISLGSAAVLQSQPDYLNDEMFTLIRFRNSLLLNQLRLRLEMLDYAWNRFVLNYDGNRQLELLGNLFGSLGRGALLLLLPGLVLGCMLLMSWLLLRRNRPAPLPPATAHYLRFCALLAARGFPRHSGETPQHYLERVGGQNPQWQAAMQQITEAYVALAFAREEADPALLARLRSSVRSFRLA